MEHLLSRRTQYFAADWMFVDAIVLYYLRRARQS